MAWLHGTLVSSGVNSQMFGVCPAALVCPEIKKPPDGRLFSCAEAAMRLLFQYGVFALEDVLCSWRRRREDLSECLKALFYRIFFFGFHVVKSKKRHPNEGHRVIITCFLSHK